MSAAVTAGRAGGVPQGSSFVGAKQPPRGPHVEGPPPPTQTAFAAGPGQGAAKEAAPKAASSPPEVPPAAEGQQLDVKL